MGVKLTAITPSRGTCIELGAAFVIIYGTGQGWPLSTTHCQIGATVAVGLFAVWKSTSASGVPDNSSLSHFSARTRPCWLRRAARNRHRHAIEQASRRWRGGRRDDSARTRRKILISTQVHAQGIPGGAEGVPRARRGAGRRREAGSGSGGQGQGGEAGRGRGRGHAQRDHGGEGCQGRGGREEVGMA